MNTVGSGHHVERRAESPGRDGQPGMSDEMVKLVDLTREEEGTENDDPDQIPPEGFDGTLVNRGHCERHEERTHQQDKATGSRQFDIENVDRIDANVLVDLSVDQVSGDQRPEEHTIRGQKQPHHEFLVVEPGRNVFERGGSVVSVTHEFVSSG